MKRKLDYIDNSNVNYSLSPIRLGLSPLQYSRVSDDIALFFRRYYPRYSLSLSINGQSYASRYGSTYKDKVSQLQDSKPRVLLQNLLTKIVSKPDLQFVHRIQEIEGVKYFCSTVNISDIINKLQITIIDDVMNPKGLYSDFRYYGYGQSQRRRDADNLSCGNAMRILSQQGCPSYEYYNMRKLLMSSPTVDNMNHLYMKLYKTNMKCLSVQEGCKIRSYSETASGIISATGMSKILSKTQLASDYYKLEKSVLESSGEIFIRISVDDKVIEADPRKINRSNVERYMEKLSKDISVNCPIIFYDKRHYGWSCVSDIAYICLALDIPLRRAREELLNALDPFYSVPTLDSVVLVSGYGPNQDEARIQLTLNMLNYIQRCTIIPFSKEDFNYGGDVYGCSHRLINKMNTTTMLNVSFDGPIGMLPGVIWYVGVNNDYVANSVVKYILPVLVKTILSFQEIKICDEIEEEIIFKKN